MRTPLTFIGLVLFIVPALRAQQSSVLTPQTLSGWTIAGADLKSMTETREFSVPAGAQLARLCGTNDLAVKTTTTPVIGENPTDWPVLEIGEAALVYSRNEKIGRLILVLGDAPALELPFTFNLDSGGRSIEPLVVVFEKHGTVLSLSFAGETQQFPMAPTAVPPEVIVSAGATQSWSFEHFELVIGSTNGEGGKEKGNAPPPVGAATEISRQISPLTIGITGNGSDSSTLGALNGGDDKLFSPSGSVELEVFTPPSVRYGRVDSARLSAAQLHK